MISEIIFAEGEDLQSSELELLENDETPVLEKVLKAKQAGHSNIKKLSLSALSPQSG